MRLLESGSSLTSYNDIGAIDLSCEFTYTVDLCKWVSIWISTCTGRNELLMYCCPSLIWITWFAIFSAFCFFSSTLFEFFWVRTLITKFVTCFVFESCVRNDSLSLVFSSLPDQLPFFVCRIWLFGLLVDKLQWRNYWVETMEHLFYEVKVSARTSLQYEQLLPEKKFSYSFRSLKLFVAISFQCSVRFCIRSDFFFHVL